MARMYRCSYWPATALDPRSACSVRITSHKNSPLTLIAAECSALELLADGRLLVVALVEGTLVGVVLAGMFAASGSDEPVQPLSARARAATGAQSAVRSNM